MNSHQRILTKIQEIGDKLPPNDENSKMVKAYLMMLFRELEQKEAECSHLQEMNQKIEQHLIRNGKEIMKLTHEKYLLEEVIEHAPNKEELLGELEELKKLPLV